jgi:beta-glucosidase/6-phospho-beta-glucosidase/beta-galactosidase
MHINKRKGRSRRGTLQEFMFASFIQAGFECSSHKSRNGKRLDLTASTRHDCFVRQDYARLKSLGIRTAREGLRWHLIERAPATYDFSSVLPMIDAANDAGIQVVWDLFHFGWPDHLNIFHPAWIDSFAELTIQFACLWKREAGTQAFIAPVNEISFFARVGGDNGCLNDFPQKRGAELKAQLVLAGIKASQAIRSELSDAVIVSPEPVIHVAGDAARPNDVRSAEQYRLSMFEAWDMLRGDARPELGGHKGTIDVLGLNYYDRNQWWNSGATIHPGDPEYRPFHQIVKEVFDRYQCPLFISETGTEDERRPEWFAYIAAEVRTAIQLGIPVHGICLYPILNHPGWEDDRHCFNGLWDYAGEDGSRPLYEPLAREIQKQEEIRNQMTQENRK